MTSRKMVLYATWLAIILDSQFKNVVSETAVLSVVYSHASLNANTLESAVNCTATYINNKLPNEWSIAVKLPMLHVDGINDPTRSQFMEKVIRMRRNDDIMAVVGPSTEDAIRLLHPHIVAMSIPHFSPTMDNSNLKNNLRFPLLIRMVNTYRSTEAQVILHTVAAMGWSNLGVLVENDDVCLSVFQSLWVDADNFDIKIQIINHFNGSEVETGFLRKQLISLKQSGQRVFVILSHFHNINQVLEEAKLLGMMTSGWAWILTSSVMDRYLNNNGHTTNVSMLSELSGLMGIYTKVSSEFSHEFVKECGHHSFVIRKYIQSVFAFANGLNSILLSSNQSGNLSNIRPKERQFKSELFRHILSPSNSSQTTFPHAVVFDPKEQIVVFPTFFEVLNLQNGSWFPVGNFNGTSASLQLNRSALVLMEGSTECMDYITDLQYQSFDIVTFSAPPFVMIEENETLGNKFFHGYAFDLLRQIHKEAAFSYNVRILQSGVFGSVDSYNGHWNGLIGELVAGEADLVVAPLTITNERTKVVDFTTSYHKTDLKYLFDADATRGILSGSDGFAFLLPFTSELWAVIAASVFVFACYLTLVSHLSPYGAHGHYFQSEEAEKTKMRQERRRSSVMSIMGHSSTSIFSRRRSSVSPIVLDSDSSFKVKISDSSSHFAQRRGSFTQKRYGDLEAEDDSDVDEDIDAANESKARRQMSFSNALYFAFAGLLWQSPESVPRAPSSRIAAAVWYMIGVIVVASYTANMVAFVNKDWESSHLLHVRELLAQSVITPGTIYGSSVHSYLLSSNLPIAEKLYESMLQNPSVSFQPNLSVSLEKSSTGQFSLIWESSTLDYSAVMAEHCRLKTVPLGLGEHFYGFALSKNSPFTEKISEYIQKYKDNGFIEELNQKYFNRPDGCKLSGDRNEEEESFSPLTYSSLSGVFVMLVVAAAVSLLVLLVEWFVAAFFDVDRSDPKRPASMQRAFKIRWKRLRRDARKNWLPLRKLRGLRTKFLLKKTNKRPRRVLSSRCSVEPDQWKRYASSASAGSLKPGQSISVTDVKRSIS